MEQTRRQVVVDLETFVVLTSEHWNTEQYLDSWFGKGLTSPPELGQ